MGTDRSATARDRGALRSDCARCTGLCCVALRFARSADFAFDKAEGEPCRHLAADHRCGVHDRLPALGMRGCTVFECFGAGQQVTQVTYAARPPGEDPDGGAERHAVFAVLRAVHEMRWLLTAVLDLAAELAPGTADEARDRDDELALLADADPAALLAADVPALRAGVGDVLRRVSLTVRAGAGAGLAGADLLGRDLRRRNLRDADLRGALLVAADLRGVDLGRADLLGADLRDADLRGADASRALFLTQPQVNAARGDTSTRLPAELARPGTWR